MSLYLSRIIILVPTILFFFTSTLMVANAGNTATVVRGHQPLIVGWTVLGGYGASPNCAPSTNVTPLAVRNAWMTLGGASIVGTVSLPAPTDLFPLASPAFFACTHVSGATDQSNLIVNDCTGGLVWNGSACGPAVPPVISSFTNNGPVAYNTSAILSYGVTGATSCSVDNGIGIVNQAGGTLGTASLTTNTTYTLTCSSPGGSTQRSTTVAINPPANCTAPWGAPVLSGSSVTAYQSASVTFPSPCISEPRTCTNGVLSGTFTNQSCVVNAATAPLVTVTANTANGGTTGSAFYGEYDSAWGPGSPTTNISWTATNVATSCTVLRNGSPVAGATYAYPGTTLYPIPAPGITTGTTYSVTCTNGTVGTGNTVTFVPPPAQTNAGHTCNAAGTSVTTTWTMPGGYNDNYVRLQDTVTTGVTYINNGTGNSYTFSPIVPGRTYSWWGHTRLANGNWGISIGETFSCAAPGAPVVTLTTSNASPAFNTPVTLTWTVTGSVTSCTASGDWSGSKNILGDSESTPNLTIPQTYNFQCTGPGGPGNTASVPVTPGAAPQPDLTVVNTSPANAAVINNPGTISFTGSITNTGGAPTVVGQNVWADVEIDWNQPNCAVAVVDDVHNAGGPWTSLVPATPQGINATLSSANSQLRNGTHCYRMIVDRGNLVGESNDGNNGGSPWRQITISGLPECSDGIDNDGVGGTDYPADTDCPNDSGSSESPAPVNGVCGTSNGNNVSSQPSSNLCSVGALSWTDQTAGDGTYNWSCNGSSGGSNASCSANRISGSINVTGCDIPTGASNCNAVVSWTSTNNSSPRVVAGATQISTAPSNPGVNHPVTNGPTTFGFYDGPTLLDAQSVTTNCAPGNAWGAGVCVNVTVPPTLTVTQSGSPVTVVKTNSPVSVVWDTNNASEVSCSLTGGGLNHSSLPGGGTQIPGSELETGSVNTTITGRTTFVLTCPGNTVTKTIDTIPQNWES